MRYFVTGATGFLGAVLVRDLVEAGHEVAGLVRDVGRADDLIRLGVDLFPGDITDRTSLRPALEGVDGVFHLAAWYEIGRWNPQAEAINVEGTRNVLEVAWEAGVGRIVYTSTLAVFSDTKGQVVNESYRYNGRHLSQYDRTKWEAHYRVAEPLAREGAPVVILQPGVIYGAGDHSATGRMLRSYLRHKLAVIPRTAAYCWAHVEDTARAHVLGMERGQLGEAYIVAGPPHTLVEAFQIAEGITGIAAPRIQLPPTPLRFASSALSALARVLPALEGRAELLRVAGATYLGDSSKAMSGLGFRARSLQEGFREVLPQLLAEVRPVV